ncbi:MAG TPA: tetratricopeptide repeat protein [Longimicrobium sp.]|nr:tetratricopeptide repeat protein [Longimicrobium sp.]
MIALPFLLLGMLELGLRLVGFGRSYPLFVQAPAPGYLLPNAEVARRYFRAGTIVPIPQADFFRAEKRPGTFRIFFQGESSAAGFPYRHGGAPSRMLQARLQATFPDREVEVVNTALTAISSYTLLDQAGEIIAQQPDAVLIYTGHNEFYGVYGVASTQLPGRRRTLIRAYLALSRLRVTQLLARLIPARGASPSAAGAPRTAMELMAGDRKIPLGSPLYREGLDQFRDNLAALLSRYRDAGIPVLIGTVASNERNQPPFVSGFAPGADTAAWRRSVRAGTEAMRRGDLASAETALRTAVRIDSTAADGLFALARVLDRKGDAAQARAFYRAAREHDQLRFRAPAAINAIIREEAARHGATVVETERALERAAPGGVVGGTLMLEHLHPNLDGFFLISDAFYEALRAKRMIGPWRGYVPAAPARAELPVSSLDSVVGVFRADRVRSGWPFQPAGTVVTPVVDTLHPRTAEEELAQAVVRETVPWPDATDRLRGRYEQAGNPAQALRAARALAYEYRTEPTGWMQAGQLAYNLGRWDEALRYIRRANALQETVENAQLVGLLLLRRGEHDAARRQLGRAVQISGGDARVSRTAAAASALPTLERTRATAPADTAALFRLANAYALTYQYDRAREALAALQRIAPTHPGAREMLSVLPR